VGFIDEKNRGSKISWHCPVALKYCMLDYRYFKILEKALKQQSSNFLKLFLLEQWRLTCWDFVCILYTVEYPGPIQVTVGEPVSHPGQLRPLSGVAQFALANWAPTSPELSHHIPYNWATTSPITEPPHPLTEQNWVITLDRLDCWQCGINIQ
jgi:hypothetical protein